MSFVLKAAPATVQRMMNSVLRNSIGDSMDDILVLGETLHEHNSKLREVFEHLRKYNIKLEPDKCEFLKPELSYLGHVVTPYGVKPDFKKIEAVIKFPTPQNTKDVKSFLGLAGYYRKFIADFSSISKPLTELLKKNVDWQWTETEKVSFEMLKEN